MSEAPKPALISVRQTAADSKWAGKACPKCNNPIEAGQAAVLCPKCYTPQHLDCWRDNGNKCAVDGTPANVIDRTGARPAAAAEAAPAPAAAAAAPASAVSAPAASTAASSETAAVATAQQTTASPASVVAAAPAPAAPAAARPAGSNGGVGRASAPARPAPAAAGAQSAAAMRSAARRSQVQLTVWPHLLMPEFLSAVLLIMGLTVMSWFVNAPLEEHSNPNRTPNPSKAPWYFLNLQELLVHMHPALAGVIIPTLAIILLMVIPYLDVTSDDTGVWFSGARGKRI